MLRFVSLNKSINLRYLVFDNLLEYWNSINLSNINLRSYLIIACNNGQLKFLKFVHNKLNISCYYPDVFYESCLNDQCQISHWLLETFSDINIRYDIDHTFRLSCSHGHRQISRWLLETFSDINVHSNIEYTFRRSCENGHCEISHWLVETFSDIDVHANNEFAFQLSCFYGNYETAHWLFHSHDVDIYANNNWVFINIQIIRIVWLLDIIDVRYDDDILIKNIFESDNCVDRLSKLKYLCELCPEYYLEFTGDKLVGYKVFELFIKG